MDKLSSTVKLIAQAYVSNYRISSQKPSHVSFHIVQIMSHGCPSIQTQYQYNK